MPSGAVSGAIWSSPVLSRAFPGALRDPPELSEAVRSSPDLSGPLRSSPELSGAPRRAPRPPLIIKCLFQWNVISADPASSPAS
eukprot:15464593-Alexandrium_andersonii.AAC.1